MDTFGDTTASLFASLLTTGAMVEWKTDITIKRRVELLFRCGGKSRHLRLLLDRWEEWSGADSETTAVEVSQEIWDMVEEA